MFKKVGKILLLLLLILISLVVLFIGGTEVLYRTFGITTEVGQNTTKYIDEDFSYSLIYPNDWERENTIFYKGLVELFPPDDPTALVSAWYKYSDQINNQDELILFIEDEAKYIEEEQGGKIIEINTEKINGKDVVYLLAESENDEGILYTKQYFFPDYEPVRFQDIFVWTLYFESNNKDFLDSEEVDQIKESYILLPYEGS